MTSMLDRDQHGLPPKPGPKPDARRRRIAMRRLFAAVALTVASLWIADEVRLLLLDIDDAIAAVDAGNDLNSGSYLERRLAAPLRYWKFRTARRVLSRLSEEGDAAAPLMLGQLYCQALGVDYDGDAAQRLYATSAERGFLPAFVALADTFAGANAPVHTWCGGGDREDAIHWRLKAAEHGHVDSLAEAGFMLLWGSGLTSQTGQNMLEEAWEAGSYHAAYRIAFAGELGRLDQPMPPAEQLHWYRTAALGGNPEAMKRMIHLMSNVFPGFGHERPEGPRRDGLEDALRWSLISAVWWGETDSSFLAAIPSIFFGFYPDPFGQDYWLLGTSDRTRWSTRRLMRLSGQERSEYLGPIHAQTLAWIERIENGLTPTESRNPYAIRESPILSLAAIGRAEQAALDFLKDNPVPPPVSPAPPPAIVVPMESGRHSSGSTHFG